MKARFGTLVGLDIETSGSDANVHEVLQVGASFGPFRDFSSYIKPPADCVWDPEAKALLGWPDNLLDDAPSTHEVDAALARFLTQNGPLHRVVPVGWNVGSFDVPFLRLNGFGATSKILGYQALDLNSLTFSVVAAESRMNGSTFECESFKGVKDAAKKFAKDVLDTRGDRRVPHDGLSDAQAALLEHRYLTARLYMGYDRPIESPSPPILSRETRAAGGRSGGDK